MRSVIGSLDDNHSQDQKVGRTSRPAAPRTMPNGRVNPADARRGVVSMHVVLSDVQACRDILAYIEVTANGARPWCRQLGNRPWCRQLGNRRCDAARSGAENPRHGIRPSSQSLPQRGGSAILRVERRHSTRSLSRHHRIATQTLRRF